MDDVRESDVRRLVREAVERALQEPDRARSGQPGTAAGSERKIAIGCDHGGYGLKEILKRFISDELAWEVMDCGTHSTDAVDYPDYAAAVAREVASGRCARGLVIDAAGIGSTMAANKIAGVRCALCHDDAAVVNAREHNDANLMAIGAKVVNRGLANRMVRLFLTTAFAAGRHERRVRKIMNLERAGN